MSSKNLGIPKISSIFYSVFLSLQEESTKIRDNFRFPVFDLFSRFIG